MNNQTIIIFLKQHIDAQTRLHFTRSIADPTRADPGDRASCTQVHQTQWPGSIPQE